MKLTKMTGAMARIQDAKDAKISIFLQCPPLLYRTGDARSLFPRPAHFLAPRW